MPDNAILPMPLPLRAIKTELGERMGVHRHGGKVLDINGANVGSDAVIALSDYIKRDVDLQLNEVLWHADSGLPAHPRSVQVHVQEKAKSCCTRCSRAFLIALVSNL